MTETDLGAEIVKSYRLRPCASFVPSAATRSALWRTRRNSFVLGSTPCRMASKSSDMTTPPKPMSSAPRPNHSPTTRLPSA